MKTIILAGGWGSRMGDLADLVPKPMINIGSRPILWHIIQIYMKYGFNDFIIALGVKGNVIKDYFINYKNNVSDVEIDLNKNQILYNINKNDKVLLKAKITLVETGLNTLKGARIKRLQKYLGKDENFFLTYGDGLSDVNLKKLLQFHIDSKKIFTITGVRPSGRFGELKESNNIVKSFKEKPKSNSLINGGFMVFNKKLLDYLSSKENCDLEYGVLEKLARLNQVSVFKHKGNWECMDHERDVKYLNDLYNKNSAFWI